MDDMKTPCRHPAIDAQDTTQKAKVGDQYAARHNPFVYFHSIIDDDAACRAKVVDLANLNSDIQSVDTTPNFSFIVPNVLDEQTFHLPDDGVRRHPHRLLFVGLIRRVKGVDVLLQALLKLSEASALHVLGDDRAATVLAVADADLDALGLSDTGWRVAYSTAASGAFSRQ